MGFYRGPKLITDSLVLYLDAANPKSYIGSGTTWTDLTNEKNNGSLINGPTFNNNNKGSIVFDGINDYVNFPEISPPNTINNFSFGLWFSPTVTISPGSLTTFSMLIEVQDQRFGSSRPDNYIYFLTNGELLFATFTPTNNLTSLQTTWVSNEWYNVFCTYESSTGTKKLFINGELENSVTGVLGNYFNTFTHFGLGSYNATSSFSPTNGFNGKISTVKVYNRELYPKEILQNYNVTKSRFGL
jgi:hypothetical protein